MLLLKKIMTSTTITDNFSLTYLNQACLIQMPSNFTSVEANSFKQLFQQFCQKDSILFRGSFFGLSKNGSAIKKIILDFGQTTFIDSNGLVGLCQIVQLAKNTKFDLTFCRFSPQVKMILSLAGLEQVFAIEDDKDAIVTDDSVQQTNIHTALLSKRERLLDICDAIVGLGIMIILFLPITIATKINRNEFLPNL